MDTSQDRFNLVVIGGGAAGLVAAYTAAALKARVALVEEHRMGGDCLNTGCVPSKAILRTARYVAELRRHADYGVRAVEYTLDFADVMQRVHGVIARVAPHDSVERYTDLGVECIAGRAELVDAHTVRVGDRTLRTRAVVLALGAAPFVPPVPGLRESPHLTSDTIWSLAELPRRLTILGGGPIGCELAQAFARLGSQVTVVEMAPRILPREEDEVAAIVADRLRADGVDLRTGTRATAVESGNRLVCERDGASAVIEHDRILVAVGRRARTDGIDWKRLGIELNPNATIRVDRYLRTTRPGVYAAGDLAGPYQFTHSASHQAWCASFNALFAPFWKFAWDTQAMPWVTYTEPEVAHIGHTEQSAREAGLRFSVARFDLEELDRAITEGEREGFAKILADRRGRILGATVVAARAGEMLGEISVAMRNARGLNGILGTIHSYPTYSEALRMAAGAWRRQQAPAWAMPLLARFHSMRRQALQ